MIETISKFILIAFGFFFIASGFLMVVKPEKARTILRKAGSTAFINYAELSIRMIPGIAFILYAEHSKFESVFRVVGWFMIVSSVILMLIPRITHHQFSLRAAEILKPNYFRIISPVSFFIGGMIIYTVSFF